MPARKPLFMGSEGFAEEMATSDSMTLGGLTMGGDIAMGNHNITGLPDTPSSGSAAANKNYVDSVAQSLVIKKPVLAIETLVNVTKTGLARTIDGIAIDTDGMRVLLIAQSTASENGIWVAHSGAWTRPTDFATGSHADGAFCFVEKGSAVGQSYADTGWVCTTDDNDVVDTDPLTFVQFSAAGVILAGDGLSKTGSTIAVKSGDGIETTSNSHSTNVALSGTNPGLALVGTAGSKTLEAKVYSDGGVQKDSNGLSVKLNGTTLQVGSSGLSVKGVPSAFEIGGSGTDGTHVTAANLGTLTDGSNADALHSHATVAAPSAARVEDALAVTEAIAKGDPVYFSTTNDQVSQADVVDSKAKVIGVARTAQTTPGQTAPIVAHGPCPSVLTGATAGTPYYLKDGGGLDVNLPGGGKRVIRVGVAKNATDLWVAIIDYGKKAA